MGLGAAGGHGRAAPDAVDSVPCRGPLHALDAVELHQARASLHRGNDAVSASDW